MQTLSDFYKSIFGCKVYKISIDASCTCPNRDGTKGVGGCIFCSESGSGDFVPDRSKSIKLQVEEAKLKILAKLQGRSGKREGKFIAYFQNFTSTYGNPVELEKKYLEALECENVVGLAIATRPDCLNDEILEKIARISKTHFVQIELGLQTSNEKTGKLVNRCYTNEDFSDAIRRIKQISPEIHIVSHLIFGLPHETESDMMSSLDFVISENNKNQISRSSVFSDYFGIKITVLYVLKNTKLAEMYSEKEFDVLSESQYLNLIETAVKKLPENCVVHRLTGDPPKSILIEPKWTENKKFVMNKISSCLHRRFSK